MKSLPRTPICWSAGAVGLCLGGAAAYACFAAGPARRRDERKRRELLVQQGRIIDATVIDISDLNAEESGRPNGMQLILYKYEAAGVVYECSQDVTMLRHLVNIYDCRLGFPASVRYDPHNPANPDRGRELERVARYRQFRPAVHGRRRPRRLPRCVLRHPPSPRLNRSVTAILRLCTFMAGVGEDKANPAHLAAGDPGLCGAHFFAGVRAHSLALISEAGITYPIFWRCCFRLSRCTSRPARHRSKDLWLSARRRAGGISQRAHPGPDRHLDRHRGCPSPQRAGASATPADDDRRRCRRADERRHRRPALDHFARRQHPQHLHSHAGRHAFDRGGDCRRRAILFTGHNWIDPVLSILIAALILWSSLSIVRETLNILLEGTPRGCLPGGDTRSLSHRRGQDVHDLHVWSLGSQTHALASTSPSPTSRHQRALASWSR